MAHVESLPPADAEEARRRNRIMADYGAFSGPHLAELGDSTAGNRSQTAYRWRREGRVFAVPYGGANWYLTFQFDDVGRPLPVVAEVLQALAGWPPWELAEWFVSRSGVLGRRRPVDLLRSDPEAVTAAARFDGRKPDR